MTRNSSDGKSPTLASAHPASVANNPYPVLDPSPGFVNSGDSATSGDMAEVEASDVASYMADLLIELRALARKSGFETLGRVLEIAETEAKLKAGGRN